MTTQHGTLVRAMVLDGAARMLWVEAGDLASQMASTHGLKGRTAQIAAEAMVANLLMSAYIKGEERVSFQLQCSEPRCAFTGEADAHGQFRGWCSPQRLPAGGTTLEGILLVIKSNVQRELYRGATPVESTTMGGALNVHLEQNGQLEHVLRIESEVGEDGHLKAARGVLVEQLPPEDGRQSVSEQVFRQSFEGLEQASLAEQAASVAFGQLWGHTLDVLEARPLFWKCRCSRQKVEGALMALDNQNLQEMYDEDGGATLSCHFCLASYEVRGDDFLALMASKG